MTKLEHNLNATLDNTQDCLNEIAFKLNGFVGDFMARMLIYAKDAAIEKSLAEGMTVADALDAKAEDLDGIIAQIKTMRSYFGLALLNAEDKLAAYKKARLTLDDED